MQVQAHVTLASLPLHLPLVPGFVKEKADGASCQVCLTVVSTMVWSPLPYGARHDADISACASLSEIGTVMRPRPFTTSPGSLSAILPLVVKAPVSTVLSDEYSALMYAGLVLVCAFFIVGCPLGVYLSPRVSLACVLRYAMLILKRNGKWGERQASLNSSRARFIDVLLPYYLQEYLRNPSRPHLS